MGQVEISCFQWYWKKVETFILHEEEWPWLNKSLDAKIQPTKGPIAQHAIKGQYYNWVKAS